MRARWPDVTKVLAITTPVSALGALLATGLAGRVSGAKLVAAGAIGTAGFGLGLIFAGYGFTTLTVCMCGVIMFIYVGFPSIYAGIARLDATGRSAATAQSSQLLGPVFGPAVGAIIAVHSVTAFAAVAAAAIAGGILLALAAVWPALTRELAPDRDAAEASLRQVPHVV
jgi:MFS family permease